MGAWPNTRSGTGQRTAFFVLTFAFIGLCSIPFAVRAQEAVALVIAVDGEVGDGGVEPFTELLHGESVSLWDRSRLIFVHYQRCEQVTVASGRLTLRRNTYRLVGGRIVERVLRPCPKLGLSDGAHGLGGVVFRGSQQIALSPEGRLIVTGPLASDVATARVRVTADEAPFDVEIVDGVLNVPALPAEVRRGDNFELELVAASGRLLADYSVSIAELHEDVVIFRVD